MWKKGEGQEIVKGAGSRGRKGRRVNSVKKEGKVWENGKSRVGKKGRVKDGKKGGINGGNKREGGGWGKRGGLRVGKWEG